MRPVDKKKVLFYNDKALKFAVDDGEWSADSDG